MRILVNFKLSGDIEGSLVGDNTIYRPDLEDKSSSHLKRTLTTSLPNVLITRTLPVLDVVSAWRMRHGSYPVFIVYICDDERCPDAIGDVAIHRISANNRQAAEIQAFIVAENIHTTNLETITNQSLLARVRNRSLQKNATVAMVGAGIVNLLTAYYLNEQDYKVKLFDASPEPFSNSNWTTSGCTYGGDDARMFSLSESRHHLIKYYNPESDVGNLFRTTIPEKGWLCVGENKRSDDNDAWIRELEQIPSWLPPILNDDIISFNQESASIWKTLQQDQPALFENVGFTPTVLRIYSTESQFLAALASERAIGSIKRILDQVSLAREFPALREAIDAGTIAGALEVVGFTVNIHKFSIKLIKHLEDRGVKFQWCTEIDQISRDDKQTVIGLVSNDQTIIADHYVVSPGAYGNSLLVGMASEKQITGVVGAWMRIPNIEPRLNASLKISRLGFGSESAAEGANIIVGSDSEGNEIIHVSSGHGFIGFNPKEVNSKAINDLFKIVEDTAQRYFPIQYEAARSAGLATASLRWCVRPWTPSGLGVFELARAEGDGLLIVTGGHNTGGFAQAPSVAMAVLAALRGERHLMHRAYHPKRLRGYVGNEDAVYATAVPSTIEMASVIGSVGM